MRLPVESLAPRAEFRLSGEGLDVLPRMKLVLGRAGHASSLASVGEELRREADVAYARGKDLSRPEALVVCAAPDSFPAGCAPEEFYACDLACVFASTLGEAVEREADSLFSRGSSLKAVLLDAWSSESLEAFNESIHAAIAETAARDALAPVKLKGVERFSPGYGDISTLANVRLLEALPSAPVRASEKTGILFPKKSTVCLLAFKRPVR